MTLPAFVCLCFCFQQLNLFKHLFLVALFPFSMNRRSVLGASHVEVSATSYENNFFTLNVKKDDFNWSVKKRSSELIFFRNSILDVAARFNNSFPVLNEENKELLSELSDWLRECADVMNYSSAHSGIFYTFLKVNEYAW